MGEGEKQLITLYGSTMSAQAPFALRRDTPPHRLSLIEERRTNTPFGKSSITLATNSVASVKIENGVGLHCVDRPIWRPVHKIRASLRDATSSIRASIELCFGLVHLLGKDSM